MLSICDMCVVVVGKTFTLIRIVNTITADISICAIEIYDCNTQFHGTILYLKNEIARFSCSDNSYIPSRF